jgi:hypothetical protein
MVSSRDREGAYMRHLQSRLSGEKLGHVEKPVIGRYEREELPPKTRKTLVICAGLLAALLVLISLSLFSKRTPKADPGVQQEAIDWARSSVRTPIVEHLRNSRDISFSGDSAGSVYLGSDRWKVVGTLVSVDPKGDKRERKWESEVQFSPKTKTGDVVAVHLDGVLIYSNLSLASAD